MIPSRISYASALLLVLAIILTVTRLDFRSPNLWDTLTRGPQMKLLLITLEYKASTFSGNGVYSQSIVQSLVRSGHDMFVISAKPRPAPGKAVTDAKDKKGRSASGAAPRRGEGRLVEMEVGVERRNWGRLDWKSPWESFAAGVSREFAQKVSEFAPEWALVVDWSGVPAFSKLAALGSKPIPLAFLNFRIYYLSQYGGEDGQLERNFYRFMESRAVSMSAAIAALSSGDAQVLTTDLASSIAPGVVPKPLWPPLRKDIRTLASPPPVPGYMRRTAERAQVETADSWAKDRKFFTCCVRLSVEKNALLFAMIVEKLAGFLAEHEIIPAICGGAKEDAYGKTVKDRVKRASPLAVIFESFMGAAEMADLYSRTLLNVHPCIYDAYGMTIVEAAAFGTPSIVHLGKGGIVGAAELLDPQAGLVFAVDMKTSVTRIAEEIKTVLRDRQSLAQVGKAAAAKSLAWDEDANAKQLLEILQAGQDNLKQQGMSSLEPNQQYIMHAEAEEEIEDQTEEQEDRMSISLDNSLEISEITEQEAEAMKLSMQTVHETYHLSKEELEIPESQEAESEDIHFELEEVVRESVKRIDDEEQLEEGFQVGDNELL